MKTLLLPQIMIAGRINSFFLFILICLLTSLNLRASESFVSGEALIKLKDPAKAETFAENFASKNIRIIKRLGNTSWFLASVPKNASLESEIAGLLENEAVLDAQPNYTYHLLAQPNDPIFTAGSLYGLNIISAPAAWDITTGSPSVVVAVSDTGIRYTHEDLSANIWTNPGEVPGNGIDDDGNGFIDDYYGWDFFFNDSDPFDENGHGTHTAGTIGAVGNNALGVVGVNWLIKLMAIKIYNSSGTGTTSAMLVSAYDYVRMMRQRGINIRVTNNSYGGCDEACGYDKATREAIDSMGDAGILNVFAAGNAGNDIDSAPFYPASYTSPSIISVAASNQSDTRAGFSNWGKNSVDLAAPGVSIQSTWYSGNSSYTALSGTSMATPHVTGAAALLAAYKPELSAASLKASLLNNVDLLPVWTNLVLSGGRLNVLKALNNSVNCTLELGASEIKLNLKGGYKSVEVDTQPGCDYSIRSTANWIFPEKDVLSGTSKVIFRVGSSQVFSRTGTIRIGDKTLTVIQTRWGL